MVAVPRLAKRLGLAGKDRESLSLGSVSWLEIEAYTLTHTLR